MNILKMLYDQNIYNKYYKKEKDSYINILIDIRFFKENKRKKNLFWIFGFFILVLFSFYYFWK